MTVKTNENAELSMRVKALEAEVARLQANEKRFVEAINLLNESVLDIGQIVTGLPGSWSRG